jgi:hypothetical protein
MNTRGQVLVAVGLAAAVIAIVVREGSRPETDPMFVTEARLRAGASPGAGLLGLHVPKLNLGQSGDAESGSDNGDEGGPGEPDDGMSKLPFVQIIRILSGGDAGLSGPDSGDTPQPGSDPEGDWKFLQRADSALKDSRLRVLAERFMSGGSGQGSGRN